MFGIDLLNLAIGMSFVFLLLSLVCSSVVEGISATFKLRGQVLQQGISRLFDGARGLAEALPKLETKGDDPINPEVLAKRFYTRPRIKSLCSPRLFKMSGKNASDQDLKLPSYIPQDLFAQEVTHCLMGDKENDPVVLASATRRLAAITDQFEKSEEAKKDVLYQMLSEASLGLDTLDEQQAQQALDRFQSKVEDWFNNTMNRAYGWYRRRIQAWLFLVACVVVVTTNADTITLVQELSRNPELNRQLANAAGQYVQERSKVATVVNLDESEADESTNADPSNKPSTQPQSPTAPGTNAEAEEQEGATQDKPVSKQEKSELVTNTSTDTEVDPKAKLDAAREVLNFTRGFDLPLGYPDIAQNYYFYYKPEEPDPDRLTKAQDEENARAQAALDKKEPKPETTDPTVTNDSASTPTDGRPEGAKEINYVPRSKWAGFLYFVHKTVGFSLTIFAVMLGGPFWFDMLNKLVSLKSSQSVAKTNPQDEPDDDAPATGVPLAHRWWGGLHQPQIPRTAH